MMFLLTKTHQLCSAEGNLNAVISDIAAQESA